MRCPKCGLENIPTARYCDCGYDFQTGDVDESKRLAGSVRSTSKMLMTVCWVLTITIGPVGLLVAAFVAFGNYDDASRKQGKQAFVVGVIWSVLLVAYFMLRIFLK